MLVFFSISPLGDGESVSGAVTLIIDLIDRSGLDYKLTAMGTIIEGPPDTIFNLLKECHAKMREGHNRVTSKILIDDRAGGPGQLYGKIVSIEGKIGREVKT